MTLWYARLRRVLRTILALFSMLFPLSAMLAACAIAVSWMRSQQNDLYYVDHNYLRDVIWWGSLGLIGLLPGGRVLFHPAARLHWLWIPTVVTLATVYTHAAYSHHHGTIFGPVAHMSAQAQVRQQLSSLYADIKGSIERGESAPCMSGPTTIASPYSRAGVRLVYQRRCLMTEEPVDRLLVSAVPGTLVIISRPGDPHVRLRATVLPADVSGSITWVKNYAGSALEFTILTAPTAAGMHPVGSM
jgi:hypothetical protein